MYIYIYSLDVIEEDRDRDNYQKTQGIKTNKGRPCEKCLKTDQMAREKKGNRCDHKHPERHTLEKHDGNACWQSI